MKPLVLIPSGEADSDFTYASGFPLETGLYVRFAEGDDVLVASPLEIDRAQAQSKAARKLGFSEAGYVDHGEYASWPRLAARLLRDKGLEEARVSPRLQAVYLEELRSAGVQSAQRAAEAAVTEIARQLAKAEIKDGILWLDGRPLTSERLYARAQLVLGEMGFTCPDMIVAGSPECAMPHFRGEGSIRADAPVIVDIFPSGRVSHYYGDLTRTLVVGKISDEVRQMHAAVLQALDAGIESIRAGVASRDVHNTVCQVLVDRGYGTTTKGFEGPEGAAKMNHSTGHGVGLDVHEEPSLRGPSEEPLAEGDVVTVEPGLYLLGLGGVRIEDTGMVTSTGFTNFTSITRSLDPKDYL
jgi:Xaa-Pro aminopeptidase